MDRPIELSSSSDHSTSDDHGDEKLSDTAPENGQTSSERGHDSESELKSSDSGYNKQLVCVKKVSPTKRKWGRPPKKLPIEADRLTRGSTCHSCRRFGKLCVVCPVCSSAFCERCLTVRHGENFHEVHQPEMKWLCPKCRRGCGRGCDIICCTCSRCCRELRKTPPLAMSQSRKRIKQARTRGWNLHDYQIHLQTNESKLEIANRKLSFDWTRKANDNGKIVHSNIIDKGADDQQLPTKHEGPVEKRSTTGDRSDPRDVTRVGMGMHNIKEKTERTTPSTHAELGSRMKREDLTLQYDQPAGRCWKRRETTLHQIDKTICDKEKDLDKMNENDALPRRSTKKFEESGDIDTKYETLCNALIPYNDLAANTYLMQSWMKREEKDLTGNRMSITLSKEEVHTMNRIKKRSHAGAIAHAFNPAKFKSLSKNEQASKKKKLHDHLELELAEYVQTLRPDVSSGHRPTGRLPQFFEEIDQRLTRDLLKAKSDIDSAIERMKALIESKGFSNPDFVPNCGLGTPTKTG